MLLLTEQNRNAWELTRVMELVLPGTRRWVRPKRRRLNGVANNIENVGAVSEDVYDRERWREMVKWNS